MSESKGLHFKSLTPMTRGMPILRQLFTEMNRQRCSYFEMTKKSGVSTATLKMWRAGRFNPSTQNLEACFNVLGRTLTHKEKE